MRVFLLILALSATAQAQLQSDAERGEPALAIVVGNSITEEDLVPLIGAQLRQIRQQEYDLKKRALEELVNRKLLETEALKHRLSVDEFLHQEIDASVIDPTAAEVEAFYFGQKSSIGRPFAEVESQLQQTLKQAKVQKARQEYLEELRAVANVVILLSPPSSGVSFDSTRLRGNPRAPVTIVEFSDFQCPFCQQAYPIVKKLLSKYGDRVRFAYRDFPVRQNHPDAQLASVASRCAGDQGHFWEYHDMLFEGQLSMDKPALRARAESLPLDLPQFDACMESGRFNALIEQDLQDGIRLGVTGTPAFFINGVLITGAQPLSVFERAIDEQLIAAR